MILLVTRYVKRNDCALPSLRYSSKFGQVSGFPRTRRPWCRC